MTGIEQQLAELMKSTAPDLGGIAFEDVSRRVRRRRSMRWSAVGSAAAVVVVAVGISLLGTVPGGHPIPPATPSVQRAVTGTLQLAGGPAPGGVRPISGEVYAFTSPDFTGKPAATAAAASDGTFSVNLPPGTYYLAGTSPRFRIDPPPATPPCHADKPAVVAAGATSHVNIWCAMK